MTIPVSDILNVKISRLDLEQTEEKMSEWIIGNKKKRLCVIPVNCLLYARKYPLLKDIYNSSDMNLADGVPVVWASKLLGCPIAGRVTGLDLLPEFAKTAEEKGFTFFFLGAKDDVGAKLAEKLKEKHANLKIAGIYSPPFAEKFSEAEDSKIIEIINEAKPNVLWVSLTAPKQDYWIFRNFDRLDVNIAIGVGGAFEVTAGLIKRAPIWMQKYGLEWFYRFLQEPKRLFRRYFIEAPIFLPLVLLQRLNQLES